MDRIYLLYCVSEHDFVRQNDLQREREPNILCVLSVKYIYLNVITRERERERP